MHLNIWKGRCKTIASTFSFYIFISALILQSCQVNIGGGRNKKKDAEKTAVPVRLQNVTRSNISLDLRLNGVIKADRKVQVFAKSTGIITELSIEEGQQVRKNQKLLKLESADQEIALKRASTVYERELSKFESTKELHSKQMTPESDFQIAELMLREAKINLDQARLQLERTDVTAPISGVVTNRFVNVGDRIDPARPALTIVDNSKYIVETWVSEEDAGKLELSQNAKIYPVDEEEEIFDAYLERISPVVDPVYGKIKLTFNVSNARHKIKPGQMAEIAITLTSHQNVIVIPKKAIIYEAGDPVVFVYSDSMAHRAPVETGIQSNDMIEIIDGLTADEKLIIDGQATLQDSTFVKPVSDSDLYK